VLRALGQYRYFAALFKGRSDLGQSPHFTKGLTVVKPP
jgi:hypothetical protein